MTTPSDKTSSGASDPVGVLALLVEACERGETNLRPYLNAGHAVIEYAAKYPIYLTPEWMDEAHPDDVEPVLRNQLSGNPSPYELWKQTGGGQPYIDAMLEHGYLVRTTRTSHPCWPKGGLVTQEDAIRCEAITEYGARCLKTARPDSSLCETHQRQKRRQEVDPIKELRLKWSAEPTDVDGWIKRAERALGLAERWRTNAVEWERLARVLEIIRAR